MMAAIFAPTSADDALLFRSCTRLVPSAAGGRRLCPTVEGGAAFPSPKPAMQAPSQALPPEIVAAAKKGNAEALERVLAAMAPHVLTTARVALGPTHPELDDVVQESLIGLSRALRGFRGEASLAHFARAIAARNAANVFRKHKSRARVARDYRQNMPLSQAGGLETELEEAERALAFRRLLADLPRAQAEALILRVVEGKSLPEVSSLTGVPVNTIRSRVRLATMALRRRLTRSRALGDLLEVPDES